MEALHNMSEDMIRGYENDDKLLTELLIRFLFFERLNNEEDRIIHNKAIEFLYDMGIFHEGKEIEVVRALMPLAEIPQEYKQEDEI